MRQAMSGSGRRRELAVMAHAATTTIVTVEEVYDGDLFADDTIAAGALSSLFADAVVHVPGGARPLAMPGYYELDAAAMRDYATAARSPEGFATYLEEHVLKNEVTA